MGYLVVIQSEPAGAGLRRGGLLVLRLPRPALSQVGGGFRQSFRAEELGKTIGTTTREKLVKPKYEKY